GAGRRHQFRGVLDAEQVAAPARALLDRPDSLPPVIANEYLTTSPRLPAGAFFPLPRHLLLAHSAKRCFKMSIRFEASALVRPSSYALGSCACSERVLRYEACAPVMGSSPETQSSGSFSVLEAVLVLGLLMITSFEDTTRRFTECSKAG